MKLESILLSVAEKLRIDFEFMSSEIEHRSAKGRVREIELVEAFLSKYVPRSVEVAQGGEIVAVTGETSNECDILILDPSTPKLIEKTGYRVVPVECVHGVIEVKSHLDSAQLEDAFKKISRVKQFPKSAFDPPSGPIVRTTTVFGREWNWFPLIGHVFAYDSVDLEILGEKLRELEEGTEPAYRIEAVWILGKGMLVHLGENGMVDMAPSPGSQVAALKSDNPLLLMTVQMQSLFQSAWMPRFRILAYLEGVAFGQMLRTFETQPRKP